MCHSTEAVVAGEDSGGILAKKEARRVSMETGCRCRPASMLSRGTGASQPRRAAEGWKILLSGWIGLFVPHSLDSRELSFDFHK